MTYNFFYSEFNVNKFKRVIFYLKKLRFIKFFNFFVSKVFKLKIKNHQIIIENLIGKSGVELGGPSKIFCNSIPLYKVIKDLDSINISKNTLWEGKLSEGSYFSFDNRKKSGYQYIRDGIDLHGIDSCKYEFAISSNAIEHFVNPIKAISELVRIIKEDGFILLLLPNKIINFDHKRENTSFTKILEISDNNIGEDNLDSLEDIKKNHDFFLDPEAGNLNAFLNRAKDNYKTRFLHHHVYSENLLLDIFKHLNLKIILSFSTVTDHIIFGQKILNNKKKI